MSANRTTGRIKKPKAVFDPSDNYLPRAKVSNNGVVGMCNNLSTAGPVKTKVINVITAITANTNFTSEEENKILSQSQVNSASLIEGVGDICCICTKKEGKRGSSAKNKLIDCLECDRRVHKLCIKTDFEDWDALRQYYKCDFCRSCVVCNTFFETGTAQEKNLITCSKCVKSYHLNCHIPNVLKYQQQTNWKCNKCKSIPESKVPKENALAVKLIREIIGDEPKVAAKPVSPKKNIVVKAACIPPKRNTGEAIAKDSVQAKKLKVKDYTDLKELENNNFSKSDELMDGTKPTSMDSKIIRCSSHDPAFIPDVKDWSVGQVVEFIANYFPNDAQVFKDHEIDGQSLLLLKRSDVIKKLPLKLGPSLRIYSLILKIQTQSNDPTLGWNCGVTN